MNDFKREKHTKRSQGKRGDGGGKYFEREPARLSAASGEYIEGRNAVIEALRAGRPINKLYIAKGESDGSIRLIISMAREAGAAVVETDRRRLDAMSETHSHQGVIADVAVKEYSSISDILEIASQRNEPPFIIICDEISDPHNLGAIIRTAEAVGAHGIIVPKRRSAGLSAVISKTSAGAVEYMSVARVANLPSAIKELQELGVWVYGTSAEGTTDIWNTDLRGPIAIVIGSEGEGMRRLVEESCDFCVSIPMKGRVSSLNASASAAVIMYEVFRQRSGQ